MIAHIRNIPVFVAIDAQRETAARIQQRYIKADKGHTEPKHFVCVGHQRPNVQLQIGHVDDGLTDGTLVGQAGGSDGQTEGGQVLTSGNSVLHGIAVDEVVSFGDVVESFVVVFTPETPVHLQAGGVG